MEDMQWTVKFRYCCPSTTNHRHKLDHILQISYYYRFKSRYSYQFKVRKVKIKLKVVPVL
jgi:hypothetical protein